MTEHEFEMAIKWTKIMDLLDSVHFPPMMLQFFDLDSDELLLEGKIK